MGIASLASRYVAGRVLRAEVRTATATQERIVLRGFARHYGDRPVAQLARTHIEAWLSSLSHVAHSTRRTYYAIVRRFCRWLTELGQIRRDPTLGVRTPKVPRSVPRALTPADTAAVWLVLPDARARCVIALMLELGLRVGEVVALELGDIDWSGRAVRVHGKGGHTREMPLTPRAERAIATYLCDRPPRGSTGPLVRSYSDNRSAVTPVYLSSLVSRWMATAGVKRRAWDGRTAHAWRHTAASELADVEPDLRVVQQFLGHVHLSSTQVYLRRVEQRRLRQAMAARSGTWRPDPAA
jgi:integrase